MKTSVRNNKKHKPQLLWPLKYVKMRFRPGLRPDRTVGAHDVTQTPRCLVDWGRHPSASHPDWATSTPRQGHSRVVRTDQLFTCKLGGRNHPLRQIAHPIQAFRPNWLIDYWPLGTRHSIWGHYPVIILCRTAVVDIGWFWGVPICVQHLIRPRPLFSEGASSKFQC